MISGMFHKIHELACMVEGTSEKIRYVLYDMYKGYMIMRRHVFHHGSIIVILSLQNERKNVKERRETHTHTHTQRATRSWKVQAFFFFIFEKNWTSVLYVWVYVRFSSRSSSNSKPQWTIFSCRKMFSRFYIYICFLVKKKKNWRDSEGFENEYDRDWTKKKGRGREGEGLQALNVWWNIFFHRENDLSPHLHAIFEAVFGSLNHDSRD